LLDISLSGEGCTLGHAVLLEHILVGLQFNFFSLPCNFEMLGDDSQALGAI
jgi:hypothetical protein